MEDGVKDPQALPQEVVAEQTLDFESALERLEEVVRSLETSELKLEDSVRLYRQAMMLVKICQERLDQAQHSVEEIEAGFAEPGDGEKSRD